jgi:hypothetical protein
VDDNIYVDMLLNTVIGVCLGIVVDDNSSRSYNLPRKMGMSQQRTLRQCTYSTDVY